MTTLSRGGLKLEAAIRQLQEEIRLQPVTIPPAPVHPDKSFK